MKGKKPTINKYLDLMIKRRIIQGRIDEGQATLREQAYQARSLYRMLQLEKTLGAAWGLTEQATLEKIDHIFGQNPSTKLFWWVNRSCRVKDAVKDKDKAQQIAGQLRPFIEAWNREELTDPEYLDRTEAFWIEAEENGIDDEVTTLLTDLLPGH